MKMKLYPMDLGNCEGGKILKQATWKDRRTGEVRGVDGSLPKGNWNTSWSKDIDIWSVGKRPSDASHSVYNLKLTPLKTK